MQEGLKEFPFTRPSRENLPKRVPLDMTARSESIRNKLRSCMKPSERDFEFMEKNPEASKWLQDHVEPSLWLKFESLASARK